MTSTPQDGFTDADLTAYLDGQADDDLQAALAAALAHDTDLQTRLATLDMPLGTLRAALDPRQLGAPEMPPHLHAAAPAPARTARVWVPAALAASFALGLALSSVWQRPAPSDWIATIASYQALYTTQTLANSPQKSDLSHPALAQAQSDLAVALDPATAIEGLEFKRAQVLAIRQNPLIQMAYLDASGIPFAFCVTRVDEADRPLRTEVSHDLATASWVENGIGYVLIGGQDGGQITTLATRFSVAL